MGDKLYNFGNGFKRARKENGYKTQQSFVDAFRYDGDKSVCIETVRNWEQNRNIPEIKMIMELCDFFSCDMDYLFYRIDCKTHNIQFIHEQTGLSEKSIDNLRKEKIVNDVLGELKIECLHAINNILSEKDLSLIKSIAYYLTAKPLKYDMNIGVTSGDYTSKGKYIGGDNLHLPAGYDIAGNVLLLEVQKKLTKLKDKLQQSTRQ